MSSLSWNVLELVASSLLMFDSVIILFLVSNKSLYSLAQSPSCLSSSQFMESTFIDSIIDFILLPMSFPAIYDFFPMFKYLLYSSTKGAFVLHKTMSPSLTSHKGTDSNTLPSLWSSFFSIEGTIFCAYSTILSAHLYDMLRGRHTVFGRLFNVFRESLSEPLN